MRNTRTWQKGSCSGGLPVRAPPHSTMVAIQFLLARAVPLQQTTRFEKVAEPSRRSQGMPRAPKQSVAPTPLPFASIRDLDCQHQQRHDQTIAKRQSSPLGREQQKRAKTPPQPDPYDAPDVGHGQEERNQGRDCGRSRTRVDHQSELDRAHGKSKSRRSKMRRQSKSQKCSKSRRSNRHKRDGGRERIKLKG